MVDARHLLKMDWYKMCSVYRHQQKICREVSRSHNFRNLIVSSVKLPVLILDVSDDELEKSSRIGKANLIV